MEKPRIRLFFKFNAFFEAVLINRYQSVGIEDNVAGYKLRHIYNLDIDRPKTPAEKMYGRSYVLNKTSGTCHLRK